MLVHFQILLVNRVLAKVGEAIGVLKFNQQDYGDRCLSLQQEINAIAA